MTLPLERHFQIAYATNDLDQAKTLFAERFAIRDWITPPVPQNGGADRAALAWKGNGQFELVEPGPAGNSVYRNWLREDGGFALRLHHLGYIVEAPFDGIPMACDRAGYPVAFDSGPQSVGRWLFADSHQALGHYLEFVMLTDAGRAFDRSIPRN